MPETRATGLTRRQCLLAAALPLSLPLPAMAQEGGVRVLRAAPLSHPLRGSAHPAITAWGYEGSVPGPLLRYRQGERLRLRFENALPQDSTIHWHGLRVPHAMDGVPHLTQPPVRPGESFLYEFELPDAGTYWYHSHLRSSEQVERGLHGLLVVDEREPPRVDRDIAWALDDWRLSPTGQLSDSFGSPHDISHAGRIGNAISVNGAAPADLALRRGERIRLRLVNVANARIFSLGFDGHAPQVIALDGHPVTPHAPPRGRVVLAPGNRCDLLLDATGRPGERHAVFDDFYPRQAFDLLQLVYGPAALRDAPMAAAVALAPNPLAEPQLQGAVRHTLRFEGGMMSGMHRALLDGQAVPMMQLLRQGKAWAINGVVSAGHGAAHAHDAPLLTLRRGQSCVLTLHNDTRWFHPIHLHGHAFRVLARSDRPTPWREWRDTVLLAPDERADIGFVADNPGDWMLHCHVLEHQDGGMMGVVRVIA
ncbi:multicopper oxidase family protein [Ramlibacter rhizophilus]|uniref:Multicopper oxidase family protein n=1 Tax=Ramlibacter rhizophilus TaxID=1781167 RepID=A0A4Z0BY96_9BURK|nr:multicopper oxidase family protein [Ramlibacter rhizophilus]TFZ04223.1 multicopper oxidase family protein [Ramlibacter rhizophilus]